MSVSPKRLYGATPAVGPAVIYTAPAGGAEILAIVASNPTAGAQAITVSIDPSGAAPAVPIWGAKVIGANDSTRLAGPIHLDTGDTIVAASPSGALGLIISGFETT